MYSFSYLEPVCCSMFSSNCCFLTCIQISQEVLQVVWYSHLFKNFPQFVVIHTVKGFGVVNKAEVDVFLELSRFLYNPVDIGSLISLVPLPFLNAAWTSESSVEAWLGNFAHYFVSLWDNWPFSVLWPLLSFPNLLAYWVQHFHCIIF